MRNNSSIISPARLSPLSALERENAALKVRLAELEMLVARDTLTPAFNRRHFASELERWRQRSAGPGCNYGLMYIDVDNLKAVNDQYGHVAGDFLLIEIAKALMASVRRTDIVARVGGDEFAILMARMPSSKLRDKADAVTKAVSSRKILHQGVLVTPSISVGFTSIDSSQTPEEMLLRADRNMYAAKHAKNGWALN